MNLTVVKESLDSLYQKALKKSSSKLSLTGQNSNGQTLDKPSQISSQMGQNLNETSQKQVLNGGSQVDEARDIDFYLNVEKMMNPIEEIGKRSLESLENMVFAGWLMMVKSEGEE